MCNFLSKKDAICKNRSAPSGQKTVQSIKKNLKHEHNIFIYKHENTIKLL